MNETTVKNFTTDGSDRSVQAVLSKLRFIATFKPGERVCIRSLSIQAEGFGSGISRWWKADGRQITLEFLRDTASEALDIGAAHLRRSELFHRQVGDTVLECLMESRQGMTSLAKTYEEDRMFVSEVETLRDMVALKLSELRPPEEAP